MKKLILMTSFLSFLFGNSQEMVDAITLLDRETYKAAIEKQEDLQLVDVRTQREYNAGHIAKAINIDFFQTAQFNESFQQLDKNRPLYIYCRSGRRSRKAAERLDSLGFKKIFDLKGGYLNWKE